MNIPKTTVHRLLGSKNKEEKEFADHYPTPSWATEELLKREMFCGTIWECACGNGAISKILEQKKANSDKIISSDIIDWGYGTPDIDFLNDDGMFNQFHFKADHIITNPPFSRATEFVIMAKKWTNCKIAMFLKTTFLEGTERHELFKDRNFPLKTMYQFSRRVSFGDSKNGGMLAFAWFVWDRNYTGKPNIEWIL